MSLWLIRFLSFDFRPDGSGSSFGEIRGIPRRYQTDEDPASSSGRPCAPVMAPIIGAADLCVDGPGKGRGPRRYQTGYWMVRWVRGVWLPLP
jgi:hypothetical protein